MITYDFIMINYLDKESGEQELFEDTESELGLLFQKKYKGYSKQLQMPNTLPACKKCMNKFSQGTRK